MPPEKDLNFYFLEREKTEKIYTFHGLKNKAKQLNNRKIIGEQ